MNRLKFNPHTTSFDFVKFNVVKGISIVAVQPSLVIRASELYTPSQPESILFTLIERWFPDRLVPTYYYRGAYYQMAELCATFATDNRHQEPGEAEDAWRHPKGDFCFPLDATQSIPQAPVFGVTLRFFLCGLSASVLGFFHPFYLPGVS
jgi:hypothetical protein